MGKRSDQMNETGKGFAKAGGGCCGLQISLLVLLIIGIIIYVFLTSAVN